MVRTMGDLVSISYEDCESESIAREHPVALNYESHLCCTWIADLEFRAQYFTNLAIDRDGQSVGRYWSTESKFGYVPNFYQTRQTRP